VKIQNSMPPSCVRISRVWGEKSDDSAHTASADSLMELALESPDAQRVLTTAHGVRLLDQTEPVSLACVGEDVCVRVAAISLDETGPAPAARYVELEAVSSSLGCAELVSRLDRVVAEHQRLKGNRLGSSLQHFQELPQRLHPAMDGGLNYDNAPRTLLFECASLQCARSLDHVHGRAADRVRRHVRFFEQNRAWFEERGLPYMLGVLLYGPPGCGKTSVIKAIAGETRRHVVSCRLTEHVTASQMRSLLQCDTLQVQQGAGARVGCCIPVRERIHVFEDADELGSLFPRRSEEAPCRDARAHPERLTLQTFLNLLDGVAEVPGRILVFTTNHVPRVDGALLRPGRFALIEHFRRFSLKEVAAMALALAPEAPVSCEDMWRCGLRDGALSPADVCQAVVECAYNGSGAQSLCDALLHRSEIAREMGGQPQSQATPM
jgi:hypothetical protein